MPASPTFFFFVITVRRITDMLVQCLTCPAHRQEKMSQTVKISHRLNLSTHSCLASAHTHTYIGLHTRSMFSLHETYQGILRVNMIFAGYDRGLCAVVMRTRKRKCCYCEKYIFDVNSSSSRSPFAFRVSYEILGRLRRPVDGQGLHVRLSRERERIPRKEAILDQFEKTDFDRGAKDKLNEIDLFVCLKNCLGC